LTGKNFEHQLGGFLLSCRVDELSPDTIKYYSYTLGAFIKFFHELGIHRAQDVTPHHIRLFLLSLQETNIPISVHAYYRAVRRFFNWLIAEGLLGKSPMSNIRPPRHNTGKR
jgi:integrase/recombinase XerC